MYNHILDTFNAVAETGSFTKAAERLFVSSTSVMNQINALESELNVLLFKRSSKGVSLTSYGKYLYVEAQKLINQSFSIKTQIRYASENTNYQIRIGITPINPLDDFTRIWQRSPLSKQFTVTLISYPSDVNSIIPKSGDTINYTDFAFASEANLDPLVPTDILVFCKFRVSCMVPHSHPLASKKVLTLKDLEGEAIHLPSRGNPVFADQFVQSMRRNHPEINVETIPLFYDLELLNRCADGRKILLACENWSYVHPEMVNLPVEWDWTMPYGLIYKKDIRPEAQKFLEAFKEAMAME